MTAVYSAPAPVAAHRQDRLGSEEVGPVVAPLHLVTGASPIDLPAARRAVADLLTALGQDPHSEHLRETPRRVADAFAELLTPSAFAFTTFANTLGDSADEAYDGLVLVRDIQFTSLCEHHMLPFSGVAHVGYLPGDRVVGLSKLARTVDTFARRLQVQERLTQQVAAWLQDHLDPRGVGVVIEAEHQCMSLRGARATGSRTITSTLLGALRDDARSRDEFLALTRSR